MPIVKYKPLGAIDYDFGDQPLTVFETLERAFGPAPWNIKPKDVDILRGMEAREGNVPNTFTMIIDKVNATGGIQVWR